MPDSGVLYAGSGAESGTGGVWNNISNALGSTAANYANSIAASGDFTKYLELTNFGFAIPTGATIDGIQVQLRYYIGGDGFGSIDKLQLIKGGTIGGSDKTFGQSYQATSATTITLGGSSDLWGLTFTDSDINASNFGFATRAIEEDDFGDSITYYIDWVGITVYFTGGEEPGGSSTTKTKNFFMLVR